MRRLSTLASALAVLAIAAPGPAIARDLSGDHFRVIGFSTRGDNVMHVDLTKLKRDKATNTAETWLMMVGPDKDAPAGAGPAAYKLVYAVFDCGEHKFKFTEGAYYSGKGDRLRAYNADNAWRHVFEDTLADAGERYLCRQEKLQIDMVNDSMREALLFSREITEHPDRWVGK
jgi:hypothetical protein